MRCSKVGHLLFLLGALTDTGPPYRGLHTWGQCHLNWSLLIKLFGRLATQDLIDGRRARPFEKGGGQLEHTGFFRRGSDPGGAVNLKQKRGGTP